ncbi:hypothetical protein WJX77_008803 [Trebouxia sp. C0004]
MGRPIIQISLKHFETRKNEIAAELCRAATEIGFVYLKDQGLTEAEMQHMLSLSKQFFKLPAEQKANFKFDLNKNTGWESGQQSLCLDFESCFKNFMQKCQNISFQFLSCFAIGQGAEEDLFTRNHDGGSSQKTLPGQHWRCIDEVNIAYFNQANKSAVIQGLEKHHPPVTAQDFVKESLAAIYLSQEGQ